MAQPRNWASAAWAGLIVSIRKPFSLRRLPEAYARVAVDTIIQHAKHVGNRQRFVFRCFGDKERGRGKPLPLYETCHRERNQLLAIGRIEEHQIEGTAAAGRQWPELGGVAPPDFRHA